MCGYMLLQREVDFVLKLYNACIITCGLGERDRERERPRERERETFKI